MLFLETDTNESIIFGTSDNQEHEQNVRKWYILNRSHFVHCYIDSKWLVTSLYLSNIKILNFLIVSSKSRNH